MSISPSAQPWSLWCIPPRRPSPRLSGLRWSSSGEKPHNGEGWGRWGKAWPLRAHTARVRMRVKVAHMVWKALQTSIDEGVGRNRRSDMAEEMVLPQWGMEMQDATIVRWLKQEGDPIREGEPLVEVETAKIEAEMESTASGVLAHILVPEGATVPIRTVLAIVGAAGEQVPRPPGTASPVTAAPATAPATLSSVAALPRLAAHGTPQV